MKLKRAIHHKEMEQSIIKTESEITIIKKSLQASRDASDNADLEYTDIGLQNRKFNEFLAYKNYELSRDLRKAYNCKKGESLASNNSPKITQNQGTIDILLHNIETVNSVSGLKPDESICGCKSSQEIHASNTKLTEENKKLQEEIKASGSALESQLQKSQQNHEDVIRRMAWNVAALEECRKLVQDLQNKNNYYNLSTLLQNIQPIIAQIDILCKENSPGSNV